MFYPQKKTYRTTYTKSRFSENEKWDYNVPPIITFEKKQPPTTEDPPVKGKKHKRYDNDNTLSADPSDHRPREEKKAFNYPAKKWRHDKFDESVSPHLFFPNRAGNKGGAKKPDRQLYCVREKQNQGNEPKETIEYHKKSFKKEEHLVRPSSAKETTASTTQDDDLKSLEDENSSFMSSLNSLLSLKDNKVKEEDIKGGSMEIQDNAVIAKGPIIDLLHSIHVADPHVLFELMLQNEKGTQNILIWDNEASYEKFLNEICEKNSIGGDMELYFKINVLKRIRDMQPNNKEVESLLNKLLDLNFRIMLREIQNFEDNIALYTRPYGPLNV